MNYMEDLKQYIESIPYGEVNIRIERVNRKTSKIITNGEETLKYHDNNEAVKDLGQMINNLIKTGYSGQAHVRLMLKDGQITLVGIYDNKETKYQG